MTEQTKKGHHYLSTLEWYALCRACIPIHSAFGEGCFGVYLVGSALTRQDFRDVDVRAILNDADFDRFFPGTASSGMLTHENGLWSLLCASVSSWLSQQTGLRIDFQVQRQSAANAKYSQRGGHFRNALLELEPCFAAGGESGSGSRPMDPNWARALRDQCVSSGVAFHFKQWGGRNKKAAGREIDGRTWDEFPSPRGAA